MLGQPIVDAGEDRGGTVLPDGQPVVGATAADFGLDGVEVADEGHAFLGDRCGSVGKPFGVYSGSAEVENFECPLRLIAFARVGIVGYPEFIGARELDTAPVRP